MGKENEKRPPGCENCKKPCLIHFTQIVNGQMQKLDMCETCPKAQQMKSPMEFGLMEHLLGIAMQKGLKQQIVSLSGTACEACGYTENEFKRTGRLGCPRCYDVFVLPKTDLLQKIQDSNLHKGKFPKNQEKRALKVRILNLTKELNNCISKEEYEQAAKIRDQIKILQEEETKTFEKKTNKH